MQKWEYMEIEELDGVVKRINRKFADEIGPPLSGTIKGKKIIEFINEMGKQGWELVSVTSSGSRFFFKRPFP